MEKQDLHLKEIRSLADKFSPKEITTCLENQLKEGGNICYTGESTEKIINVLSKAEFVKSLMNDGLTLTEAVRELARRIRSIHEGLQKED
jgi:DNA-binding MarR family transcriptional regulator